MFFSILSNVPIRKFVNFHPNPSLLRSLSSSPRRISKKHRGFYKRPEKPAPLPLPGSASSLTAEIFVASNTSEVGLGIKHDDKLDELEVLTRSIDNLPVLVELDPPVGEESILASDRIPADIPKGFPNNYQSTLLYI